MSHWATYFKLLAALLLWWPASLHAGRFPGADEAVRLVFPSGTSYERETFLLTGDEKSAAAELAGQDDPAALVSRYIIKSGGTVTGYAYLDKHRVRTLPEILMVALDADGVLVDIRVLAFREPLEYMARDEWYAQFRGMAVSDEIRMKKNIDGITGATLTARATTQCARRVMAVHAVLKGRGE